MARHRRLRRWFTRILICLFLGAITTVAVAWSLSLIGVPEQSGWPETQSKMQSNQNGAEGVSVSRQRAHGWLHVIMARAIYEQSVDVSELSDPLSTGDKPESMMPRWAALENPTDDLIALLLPPKNGVAVESRVILATGWPCLAMWSEVDRWVQLRQGSRRLLRNQIETSGYWKFNQATSFSPGHPTLVPLRPIAFGFAFNTGVYALIWFLVWIGLARLRAWSRVCRGRCVGCGYSLKDNVSGVCPECGSEVAKPRCMRTSAELA